MKERTGCVTSAAKFTELPSAGGGWREEVLEMCACTHKICPVRIVRHEGSAGRTRTKSVQAWNEGLWAPHRRALLFSKHMQERFLSADPLCHSPRVHTHTHAHHQIMITTNLPVTLPVTQITTKSLPFLSVLLHSSSFFARTDLSSTDHSNSHTPSTHTHTTHTYTCPRRTLTNNWCINWSVMRKKEKSMRKKRSNLQEKPRRWFQAAHWKMLWGSACERRIKRFCLWNNQLQPFVQLKSKRKKKNTYFLLLLGVFMVPVASLLVWHL